MNGIGISVILQTINLLAFYLQGLKFVYFFIDIIKQK